MTDTRPFRITVLLFDGVEELDFTGPWETLRIWQTVAARPVDVRTASLDGAPVRCSLGLTVTPDGGIDDEPLPDLVVHPGGAGIDALHADQAHLARMRALAERGTIMTSVCNGAMVYAAAGLLDGRAATSHWLVLDELAGQHPEVEVVRDRRWVDTGPVVTSAGVTAGIDMALHLVDRLENTGAARAVAGVLEHPWDPEVDLVSATSPENRRHTLATIAPVMQAARGGA
ncbi:DJ-1/PfpI family protein [Lentzea fradiae]|uniref:DJ-1/PfpI family protein n=1 Tax=Lentzea fradiae TaxID=200378 RepID=A0A1G8BGR8_9PSEU|nr:DJ-1/PfpI family protein [Lentzea fradiae]SDH32213.1 DJ-1/PfpI family protein [Lentzea fradiae]